MDERSSPSLISTFSLMAAVSTPPNPPWQQHLGFWVDLGFPNGFAVGFAVGGLFWLISVGFGMGLS